MIDPDRARTLLSLPGCLSKARRTGSGESNISFGFAVTEFKCQQMPSRDFMGTQSSSQLNVRKHLQQISIRITEEQRAMSKDLVSGR